MKQLYLPMNGNLNKATNRHSSMYISYFMGIIDVRSFINVSCLCIYGNDENYFRNSKVLIIGSLSQILVLICSTLSILYVIMQMYFCCCIYRIHTISILSWLLKFRVMIPNHITKVTTSSSLLP